MLPHLYNYITVKTEELKKTDYVTSVAATNFAKLILLFHNYLSAFADMQ